MFSFFTNTILQGILRMNYLEYLIYAYSLYIIIKIFISYNQISFIKQKLQTKAVLLDTEKYAKAGAYAIAKEKLSIVEGVIDFALFAVWVLFGFAYIETLIVQAGYTDPIVKAILFVMAFMLVNFVLSLPLGIYKSFGLDKTYEFSTNLTPATFIKDALKGGVLFLILSPLLIGALAYFIENVQNWWLYSFAVLFSFIILVNIFYPLIRAKMFDKFSPLPEGELRNSIEKLMAKVNFKSQGIFTVDASKRDSRLNAYFGGLGKSKRVVLFDTLIEKLSQNELIAVLGHELGHFKHGDILKNIALMGVILLGLFFGISHIPHELAGQMGISFGSHFIIIVFLFLSSLVFFVLMPIINLLSRHNEYAADEFGSEMGSSADLASALIKLVNENLSFPHSHPLYVFFYYSHPPLLERLDALGHKLD